MDALSILTKEGDKKPQFYSLDDVPVNGVVSPSGMASWLRPGPVGARARRHRDPDQDLPQDFDDKKEHYFQELGQPVDADHFTQRIKIDLRAALDAFDRTLPSSKDVALRSRGGKTQISLKPLGAQDDPAMLDAPKKEMARRWPMTSLLDVLKEVDLRIGFTRSFPTAAARQTLPEDEVLRRLLLALYGIGTNVGLKGVAAGPHNVAYKELL